jgi:hypothetical protein
MGGGSTPQPCAHCGSQLRAESRFCRICGQSVLSNGSDPIPFPDLPAAAPLNLAGGGVAPPAWSHDDTLTSLAIPAIPADWQALSYRPATRQADYQSAGDQVPGYQPPPGGGSWRRRIITGVLAVIVAVGGSAAGLLIARAHASSGHAAGPKNLTSAQYPGSPGPVSPDAVSPGAVSPDSRRSASVSAEQRDADDLASLLFQSVATRGTIHRAYNDVRSCGPGLAQDRAAFQRAEASRQDLLGRLVSLPDATALPAGTVSSLTRAWQASISADRDFAAWAQDESTKCRPHGSDANLSAATGLGNQAIRDKAAFVGRWNPIARQYHLPAYSWIQL